MLGLLRRSSSCLLKRRNFTVLALESSADDSCAAVVTSDRRILSNIVIRQHALHAKFGGIEPLTAMNAHHRNIVRASGAIQRALTTANLTMNDIDGIAYTRGPGMHGCLVAGSMAAKAIAATTAKPLIGVHHMQAHALTALFTSKEDVPRFPFLCLLVSGGHTMLVLIESHTAYTILANTVDKAIGSVIDVVARELKLEWKERGPGAELERFCASTADTSPLEPLIKPLQGFRFSFCGVQSHVERFISANGGIDNLDPETRLALARAFQNFVFGQLVDKVRLALEKHDVGHVVVSGGVASNLALRNQLSSLSETVKFIFPPIELCTDNAAMIGWAAMHRFLAGECDPLDLEVRARWSIDGMS